MKCNLALCLREEQMMLCLSQEGCKMSIMLMKKKLYMCCIDIEKAFDCVPWYVLEGAMRKN